MQAGDIQKVRQLVETLTRGEADAQEWVARSGGDSISALRKLPGDASDRRYYRLDSKGRTYILMIMEPFPAQATNHNFLMVREHLEASGVDVPRIHDVDADRGSILLEDLGDVTLLRRLQDVSSAEVERHLYQKVLDSLVQLQIGASPGAPARSVSKASASLAAFNLRFDFEKLMWEMGFTVEHFYQKYLKREIAAPDQRVLDDGFGSICQFLSDQPTVLAHRDFHSRNIMIAPGGPDGERFVMIDFQDARLGPAQYDLVSLLRDSYYQLEEQQLSRLLDYYVARYEGMSGMRIDRGAFRFAFDMMAIQRNFKAIGSFASFLNRRGNATYLKYIGNTFENIRRTLLKYPQYSRLREVLFHYYYF